MRVLRAVLAWLLVGMVPLHGFASAAMLACAHAAAHQAVSAADAHEAGLHAEGGRQAGGAAPECGACTLACCHALAASGKATEAAADAAPAHAAGPQEFATRIEPVPRKPPRA